MNDIRKTNTFGLIFMYSVVILFTVLALYPIFWLVVQSFKTNVGYMSTSRLAFPTGCRYQCFPLDSVEVCTKGLHAWYVLDYPWAWQFGRFSTLILNSIFYTSVTVISVITFSFMAGFAFAKIPSKATPLIHGSFIIGILLTLQSIMVPLFLLVNWVGLYDTRLGVLIPYIGIGLPMAVYLSTAYIKGIPDSIIESARIDGAKFLHIFWKIIMPMAYPVAATVAILQTTGTWNEFMLINILISTAGLRSLPVGIASFSGPLASDFGKQFSALVIGMIPMIIFYLIFRKQITKGVSAGAVKG